MINAVTVKQLYYTYPKAAAEVLHGLDFSISQGEILGFLGPSGAGKSTTQKILIGLLRGYKGSVAILGRELNKWDNGYYEQIGVSFELPNHFLRLTARENLDYFRSLYGSATNDSLRLLEWVGLAEDADNRVATFSKGMKIRLNVARSLLNSPKLLFLDEPTGGLDPVNARHIKDLILKQRENGTTVFVTTHSMELADELCDRVAFISAGNICLIDSPKTLKKKYGKRFVTVEYIDDNQRVASREFPIDGLGDDAGFLNLLKTRHIEAIHTQESTLENVFIQITGQELGV